MKLTVLHGCNKQKEESEGLQLLAIMIRQIAEFAMIATSSCFFLMSRYLIPVHSTAVYEAIQDVKRWQAAYYSIPASVRSPQSFSESAIVFLPLAGFPGDCDDLRVRKFGKIWN